MVPVTFSSVLFRIGTKDVFNVIYAEFTVCDNTVWEFIGAVKSLTGDLFPGNLIAREVIVSISELGRLVSLAEIEVCPLSFNCRFVLSVLDGFFYESWRDHYVIFIRNINFIHHEIVRDIDNFIIFNASGNPLVALMDRKLPNLVRIRDGVCSTI